jgi:hypothetical protein
MTDDTRVIETASKRVQISVIKTIGTAKVALNRLPTLEKVIGFKRHIDSNSAPQDHHWLFYVIDIIYVGTVYRINHTITGTYHALICYIFIIIIIVYTV